MNAPITTAPVMPDRDRILALLREFAEQRPGLEFGNYGDVAAYRAESRSITRDLHHARELLAYVQRSRMSAETLRASFDAYSGRLSLTEHDGTWRLDYCTGQYFPTEYRRAVCAVLAAACWSYWRDECMPAPDAYRVESWGAWDGSRFNHARHTAVQNREAAEAQLADFGGQAYGHVVELFNGESAGDYLRACARRELGATIARRWFR